MSRIQIVGFGGPFDADAALSCRMPMSGSLKQFLVMPALGLHLPQGARRDLPTRLLLRIPGEGHWLLDSVGTQWDWLRLKLAAEILDSDFTDEASQLQSLRELVNAPELTLRRLDESDWAGQGWPTHQVAKALCPSDADEAMLAQAEKNIMVLLQQNLARMKPTAFQ